MKRKIITLLILIMITISWAESNHNLGIAFGVASGSGFSYRHFSKTFFNETFGYQANFIAIGTKENFVVPIGIKVMKPFHETTFSQAYYLVASSVFLDFGSESENNYFVSIGAGIGMEFTIIRNLHFSLDLPITFIDIFNTYSEDTYYEDIRSIIYPIPEIGLYYNF